VCVSECVCVCAQAWGYTVDTAFESAQHLDPAGREKKEREERILEKLRDFGDKVYNAYITPITLV
jgi:hypothetical protein